MSNGPSFCHRCGKQLTKHRATGQYVFVLLTALGSDQEVRFHVECAQQEKKERGRENITAGPKDTR